MSRKAERSRMLGANPGTADSSGDEMAIYKGLVGDKTRKQAESRCGGLQCHAETSRIHGSAIENHWKWLSKKVL